VILRRSQPFYNTKSMSLRKAGAAVRSYSKISGFRPSTFFNKPDESTLFLISIFASLAVYLLNIPYPAKKRRYGVYTPTIPHLTAAIYS